MKTINVFFLFLATVLVLSACQSLETILPKNDGSWNLVKETINEYEDGVQTLTDSVTTFATPDVYTFNEDGTGTYTDDGATQSFNWTYNADTEILSLDVDGITLDFEVREWTKNDMKLFTSLEFEFFGTTFLSEYDWEFERAE
ncbi:MAG: lipocalin family protein [Bacteroidia bacterium]